jgi:hypothetical protein
MMNAYYLFMSKNCLTEIKLIILMFIKIKKDPLQVGPHCMFCNSVLIKDRLCRYEDKGEFLELHNMSSLYCYAGLVIL